MNRFGAFAQNTVGAGRRGRTKNAAKRVFRGGLEATARTVDVAESAALQCADAATTLTAALRQDGESKPRFSGLRNSVFEANAPNRVAIHE